MTTMSPARRQRRAIARKANWLWVDETWATPATSYPLNRVGDMRIHREAADSGLYRYYMLDGHEHYYTTGHHVTSLQEWNPPGPRRASEGPWHTWMVDDPPHWRAMKGYAQAARGHVLVAGLGLGLVLWALADNPTVESITVVERSHDVISLVAPLLNPYIASRTPKAPTLRIEQADFTEFVNRVPDTDPGWDTVIVDLWVAHGLPQVFDIGAREVVPMETMLRAKWPEARLAFHGYDTMFGDITVPRTARTDG